MKFDPMREQFTIECSGRAFYANCGLLSPVEVDSSYRGSDLAYGYDGRVHEFSESHGHDPLTREERAEIAAYMIAQWKAWAER